MAIPKQCGMPSLACNIEGLKKHSFILVFVKEDHINDVQRKWRGYILHSLVSASRHYNEARNVILRQLSSSRGKNNESIFHILDFAEYMENCISSIYRAVMCAQKVDSSQGSFGKFCSSHEHEIDQLRKLRNQHEHMYNQLPSGQVGNGPLYLTLTENGEEIQFRNIKFPILVLSKLIEGLFLPLCSLYPNFDPSSLPEPKGPIALSASLEVTVENRE